MTDINKDYYKGQPLFDNIIEECEVMFKKVLAVEIPEDFEEEFMLWFNDHVLSAGKEHTPEYLLQDADSAFYLIRNEDITAEDLFVTITDAMDEALEHAQSAEF